MLVVVIRFGFVLLLGRRLLLRLMHYYYYYYRRFFLLGSIGTSTSRLDFAR